MQFDIRPKESCPSYDNLMSKSTKVLTELFAAALKNQIQDLKNSGYVSIELLKELQRKLAKVDSKK